MSSVVAAAPPASSPHPDDGQAWGSRFPAISVRDAVTVEYLALQALGITRARAVIGGSLGGARALEWAGNSPDFLDRALVMCWERAPAPGKSGCNPPKFNSSNPTRIGTAAITTTPVRRGVGLGFAGEWHT